MGRLATEGQRPPEISFLFAMFHGGGNLHLIAPVLRRLTARGHRVRVLAGPRIWVSKPPSISPLLELIAASGASAIPLQLPSENPLERRSAERGLIRGWLPDRLRKARNLATAACWAPVWGAAMAAELDRERPDVAGHVSPGATGNGCGQERRGKDEEEVAEEDHTVTIRVLIVSMLFLRRIMERKVPLELRVN